MSRFSNLSRRLSEPMDDEPETPGCDPDEPETKTQESKKKDKDMTDEEKAAITDAARKEGHEAGFKAATDRMNAVFASEHYAGREATAAKLLGKPSMSAEDIVDVLADMPKAEKQELSADQQREAAEAAGRQEMQDALKSQKNSNIDADSGQKGASADEPNHGWGKAHAAVAKRYGRKAAK